MNKPCVLPLLAVLAIPCAGQTAFPNLDFEQGAAGEVPPAWFVPGQLAASGYRAQLTREGCRTGACVIITVPAELVPNMFGNIMRTMDATPFRGKQVRLRAAIRVEASNPESHGAMWMRVDNVGGGAGFFDNMMDRPIRSNDWSFYEIRGSVDANAKSLNFGVMAIGNARVWVDDVSVDLLEAAPDNAETAAAKKEILARYAEIDSAYTSGAFEKLRALATSDATVGSPMVKLPIAEAITQLKSDFGKPYQVSNKTELTSIQIDGNQASARTTSRMTVTVGGTAKSRENTGSDTWVLSDGTWRLKHYGMIGSREIVKSDEPDTVRRIAAEMKTNTVPLQTAEAGNPYPDLEAFGKAVGDARIVALGEATHGTREIFQMKHRLLEYLVKEKGFTVFSIEANWPESEAADRYIKTGEGDPKAALAAMYFWTWQTEEVLAMLEWMRAYNQAPGSHPILSFTSFDMQSYPVARDRVIEYVQRFSPDDVAQVKSAYSALFTLPAYSSSNPGFAEAAKQAESVVELLRSRRVALIKASSTEAFRNAVQMAAVAAQAARMRTDGAGASYRDQMMAKNLEWLAREAYPKEKIVVWAHNGHISKGTNMGFRPMGEWLRESGAYSVFTLGFAVHTGTVRAVTSEGERRIGLAESKIPAAASGTGTAVLSAVGQPMFFLDLKNRSGVLGSWLAEPHLFRSCGAMWDRSNPDTFMRSENLSASYDALIYLEDTQAARGLRQ